MKQILSFFILTMFSLIWHSCKEDNILTLGKHVEADSLSDLKFEYSMTASGSIDKVYLVIVDNIKYGFATDGNNYIKYLSTTDSNFVTDGSIRLGSTFSDVKTITDSKLQIERGWGSFVKLPSGWNAAFFIGETGTDHPPFDNSEIKWFFKR